MVHRPMPRRDSLRQRVSAGRRRRAVQLRRAAAARRGGRRVIALAAALAMVAGVLTVTQLASSALEDRNAGLGACEQDPGTAGATGGTGGTAAPATEGTDATGAPEAAGASGVDETTSAEEREVPVEEEPGGTVHRKPDGEGYGEGDDGTPEGCENEQGGSGGEAPETPEPPDPPEDSEAAEDPEEPGEDPGDGSGGDGTGDGEGSGDGDDSGADPGDNNGLDILGRDCSESDLETHTGFQEGPRCVETAFGEVGAAELNPTLLITDFPTWVEVDETFSITVSTRNLVRDRFLGAADGGYYLESSFLTEQGLTRGHFHIGCRVIDDGRVAPQPDAVPEFFTAVEDSQGGAEPDFVTIEVPGLPEPGLYRCMAWAGDPSHRVPMMERANQFVAVDVVRISVT